jgi:MFS family permease
MNFLDSMLGSTESDFQNSAFAERNWRWLFYMNIPIAGLAMLLVILFLTLKVPKEDLVSKFKRIDWL